MLRLSKLGDYAVVIMVHMAAAPERVSSAGELAAAAAVGLPTVSKLLKMLTAAGVLVSQRGAQGGYALARRPDEISIAKIIEAVEGPMGLTECSLAAGLCMQEPACVARNGWQRINRLVREALEHTSLAEFAGPPLAPGMAAAGTVAGAIPLKRSKQDGTSNASTR